MNLNIQMNLNRNGGSSSLTVYYEGQSYPATSENPSWDRILEMAMDPNVDPEQLINLLHPLNAFGSRTALSRRVSVAGNRLFFDGDEMSDGLTALIVKLLGEDGDVGPFVALLENIMQNPNEHSRKQLYRFIDSNGITITRDGMLVLYKSVYKVRESGYGYKSSASGYQSVHAGPAIVNGEPHTSGRRVPQDVGDVVEMPRSDVVFEPNVSCSTGLHVGSWQYALTFSGDTKLEVEVHPADVVSVPVNGADQKMRTCRYRVVGVVTAPYTESVKPDDVADNYCDSANVGTQEPVDVTTIPKKYPSPTQFGSARIRAKAAKKGLKAFCQQRMKWTLVDDSLDGTDRQHWLVGS